MSPNTGQPVCGLRGPAEQQRMCWQPAVAAAARHTAAERLQLQRCGGSDAAGEIGGGGMKADFKGRGRSDGGRGIIFFPPHSSPSCSEILFCGLFTTTHSSTQVHTQKHNVN